MVDTVSCKKVRVMYLYGCHEIHGESIACGSEAKEAILQLVRSLRTGHRGLNIQFKAIHAEVYLSTHMTCCSEAASAMSRLYAPCLF